MSFPYTLQFRRGTTSQRTAYVPQPGEPYWDTSLSALYVGDGSTAGGIAINGGTSQDGISKRRGTATVPMNTLYFTVSYGTTLGAPPSQVLAGPALKGPSGAPAIGVNLVYNVTASGFSVNLTGQTDATNQYYLDWEVLI